MDTVFSGINSSPLRSISALIGNIITVFIVLIQSMESLPKATNKKSSSK